MELNELLAWVISGGGAGVLAYWLAAHWDWLQEQSAEVKRYVTLAGASLLGMLAYGASVAMLYVAAPVDARGWIEALFSVAALAVIGSQALHGRRELRANGGDYSAGEF